MIQRIGRLQYRCHGVGRKGLLVGALDVLHLRTDAFQQRRPNQLERPSMTRAQKDQLVLARGMVVENQHRLLVHRRAVKVLDEQLRRRVENEKEVTSMGVQMGEHGSVQRLAERSVEVVEPDEIDDVEVGGGGW